MYILILCIFYPLSPLRSILLARISIFFIAMVSAIIKSWLGEADITTYFFLTNVKVGF